MTTRDADERARATPTCCARTSTATRRRSACSSAGTATGSGRSRCAPWATARTPPTASRTAWSRRTAGPASFRGDAAVTTWLHRVVVNACLDRLRAAKVRRTEALPDDLDEYRDRGSLASAAAEADDPADLSVREERRRQVLDALRTLPDEQRAALVLVDMEGYPVAEAAEILDCAVGTVKSRCSRGRARLAALLAPLLEADAGDAGHPPRRNPDPLRSRRIRRCPPRADPRRPAPDPARTRTPRR